MKLTLDEVNERIDTVESSSQQRYTLKAYYVQQREMNPYRYADEDDYREDLDEEDLVPYINLRRFRWGNRNREVKYGDKNDKNLENIKLKILSSQEKMILKLI